MAEKTARERYEYWLNNLDFDEATREELKAIADDPEEIEDRFYQNLAFGTAGLRGIMGAGSNRMNAYTVGRAAAGFAEAIKARGDEAARRGIAISYDSRHRSREFAELTARIFVSRGVSVYVSDELRPVPMLSYAIRHYGCAGGVMITASHNPKMYNGFKAYGSDGAQLWPDDADRVAAHMETMTDLPGILKQTMSLDEAKKSDRWVTIGKEWDDAYDAMLLELALKPELVKKYSEMPIVYTPLYGAGNKPVRRVLKKAGFDNVTVLPEQEKPNGDFPTAPYPNPELPEVLGLAIDLAREKKADLVLATDPDSDRVGVAYRNRQDDFVTLSGNEIGFLLMEYILSTKEAQGTLEAPSFCVSTIVSSRLPNAIARRHGCKLYRTLTGFKHIAHEIQVHGDEEGGHFQFGYEESFGYLAGRDVRDKDAVVACMLIAEMMADSAEKGETFGERLERVFSEYGQVAEKTVSISREGKAGLELIARAMDDLRANPLKDFEVIPINILQDIEVGKEYNIRTGDVRAIDMPQSNVLLYELSGLDFMCVRPSGTEPKIKIYFGCYDREKETALKKLERYEAIVLGRIEKLLTP